MQYLNTSEVTDMQAMFRECINLVSADVSHFDTKNVTSMANMFEGCGNLTTIDVSNFNTENVKSMFCMFWKCSKVTVLDVSGFVTNKVYSMDDMFCECSSVEVLDVSGFNTSNVTNMHNMFRDCKLVKTLDVSGFNTKKVSSMGYMFAGCEAVEALDVSGFEVPRLEEIWHMFQDCKLVKELDLTGFTSSIPKDYSYLFSGCEQLETVKIPNLGTPWATKMSYMFDHCESLTYLDLSSFNTAKVTDMSGMFSSCRALKTILVSEDWKVENVQLDNSMFVFCIEIVGGQGTTYNDSERGKGYAHVDGGESDPGYLTLKVYDVELDEVSNGNGAILTSHNGKTCNVTLARVIVPNTYNALCLPFAVDNDLLKQTFGDDVELVQLNSTTMEDETLYFNFGAADAIEAGKPYLIYVSQDMASPMKFNAVGVNAATETISTDLADFIPVFDVTTLDNGNENILFLGVANTLYYPSATSGDMKGFRAYFEVHGSANGAKAKFVLDNSLTGVKTILNEQMQNENVYDLQGRMVSNPTKGLYIVNGKKVIIK